jgi:RNA polymerase sigma-70 factor (ECF subfamily)
MLSAILSPGIRTLLAGRGSLIRVNDSDLKVRDRFLVLRAQTGDLAAFDELLRSVQAPLHGYIAHITSDKDAADDILQNVFLIIYRKLGWLNDAGLFRPWAFRIASREAFKFMKREQKFRHGDWEEITDTAMHKNVPMFEREFADRIPELLYRVSPASRAVIVLHYLEDFTLNETAEILGVSAGTVKSRLAYGLKTLRNHLGVGNESASDIV